MNYKILKDLIAIFKKKLRCNKCNDSISNRSIHIESIINNKVMLRCECKKCSNVVFAEVSLVKEVKKNTNALNRGHQGLKLKAKKIKKITPDDILDVKNFLKSFKGDFKEIFRK